MTDAKVGAELSSLRDLEGVVGSFALGRSGAVLGRDLPHLFDGETLSSVGLRVHRLLETLDNFDESGAQLTLRYAEHKLFLHRVDETIIGVISAPATSSAAMTMALTLVGRRVSKALESPEPFARTLPSSAPTLPAVPRPAGQVAASAPFTQTSPESAPAPGQVPPSPTRYSLTAGVPRAPEGHSGSPAPSARPRYFRGRRVD